mgnify:CR=1 FL=1
MTAPITRQILADKQGLIEAGALLRAGGLVAFPTETVYGLGADATNGTAVAGIYSAKGRPRFNPLIIHVASLNEAENFALVSPLARLIAEAFWPGPLTLVLPQRLPSPIADLALAGLQSIAIRVPSSTIARDLISASGRPIAAPSANRSGRVSPTLPAHVLADLEGRIDAVIMGKAADIGVESTIVSLLDDKPVLLRPGGVTRAEIEAVSGLAVTDPELHASDDAPLAPGMLASHYAPHATVRLNANEIEKGEAALLFGSFVPKGCDAARAVFNLSPTGDLKEAAANLFSALRVLDQSGAPRIAVVPIPDEGLGEAILDRLRRAAAPR